MHAVRGQEKFANIENKPRANFTLNHKFTKQKLYIMIQFIDMSLVDFILQQYVF